MKIDIEIAQSIKLKNIEQIYKKLDINEDFVETYGKTKAKLSLDILKQEPKIKAKLILVTAISPTPAGEGKTTTTIGLLDALNKIGKNAIAALREPSLGPVFGLKGGATGGGYSQVVPMEEINLHFTGDFHAITAANNLLSAVLDNHIHQGNSLNIDPKKVVWKRALDVNDRQLRQIIIGMGTKANGVVREDGFDITVASEIMAVLCLSESIFDLKQKLGEITVAYTYDDNPIKAKDLNVNGAMTVLLKEAIKPNLVQTLEANPVIIHGGPFANIAHGCNSLIATKMAMNLSEYVVTEAGFGADLGAEKFFDIKCRKAKLKPDAVVLTATVRALKMNGGLLKNELSKEDLNALEKGLPNLIRHINNIKNVFGLPVVVSINKFKDDTLNEINLIKQKCDELGVCAVVSEGFFKGSDGVLDLANEVVKLCENKNNFKFCYEDEDSIENKIKSVVTKIYGGSNVIFSKKARLELEKIKKLNLDSLPICMAKTQYSFSDDMTKLSAPTDFEINVKDLKICSGAGFIVVLTGDILTMPGLPKNPASEKIDIDNEGNIVGLF